MRMSKVWEIVTKFKDRCKRRGWKTSESEDWVEVKNKYHNFVLVKDIHPSSFKRIAINNKCVIQEGLTYRVVESSYTAWLFSAMPSENLVRTILENPDFSCRIALYDLSNLLDEKNLCTKLNYTDSSVFKEFENFLEDELKIRIEPISRMGFSGISAETYTFSELA
jgi:hypothetical protein